MTLIFLGTKTQAQESEDVFPFHLKCKGMVNLEHECIYTEFLNRIEALMDEEFQLEMNRTKTFKLFLGLAYTESGQILELKIESPSNILNTKFRNYLTNLKPVNTEDDSEPIGLDLEFVLFKSKKQQWHIKSMKTLDSEKHLRELRFTSLPKHKDCSGTNIQLVDCLNKKFWKHIVDNFKYPDQALNNNIKGTVNCQFNILSDGSIEILDLIGPHQILIEEAERIIKKMPQLEKGGSIMGIPTKFRYAIPITFRLDN